MRFWLAAFILVLGCAEPFYDSTATQPQSAPASSEAGAGTAGGTGESGADAGREPVAPEDTSAPVVGPADAGATETAVDVPAPAAGPTATGAIVYAQDFEQGIDGITASPDTLPPDRIQVVADPAGQRGRVLRMVWQAGDEYRIASALEPRTFVSSAGAFGLEVGKSASYAWGFMTAQPYLEAIIALLSGDGGYLWVVVGDANGNLELRCSRCAAPALPLGKMEPNRWHDFRVDLDFKVGGALVFHVDGRRAAETTVTTVVGTRYAWQGGIYNTPAGTAENRSRTVYLSNLSVGAK